jgi:hypothetical protein
MGKLKSKPEQTGPAKEPVYLPQVLTPKQQAVKAKYPHLFPRVTHEEYEQRLALAKSMEGILSDEEAEAARQSVREGRGE